MCIVGGCWTAVSCAADDVGDFTGAALVGAEKGGGGEEVGISDAPFLGDGVDGGVVEGEEGFPEEGVVVAEGGGCGDVEAVVEEDEAGFAGGEALDEDVAWVGVAVYLFITQVRGVMGGC